MQKMEETLQAWREMAPRMMALEEIQTDPAFQPRCDRLVRFKDKPRYEDLASAHIGQLRGTLEATKGAHLEPLLVADTDAGLFVIDGHHRLSAYRLAKRTQVPAKVREMTAGEAALLSKLVNLDGVKLPMHAEQARDAAWQYLAHATERGAKGLPKGESTRSVGARFHVSHETIATMLRRVPKVDLREFSAEALDPGTGWPRWKYLKEATWRKRDETPEGHRQQRAAERVARAIAKLKDREGAEAFRRGIALLRQQAEQDATVIELDQWDALDEAGSDAF